TTSGTSSGQKYPAYVSPRPTNPLSVWISMKAALRRFRHSLRNGSFVHGPVSRTVWTSVIFAFSFTVDRIIFILRHFLLGASILGIEELSWPQPPFFQAM